MAHDGVEDRWFSVFAQDKPDVWSRDAWHDKLGLREDERGFGYGVDELAAFPRLNGEDLRDYSEAVRAETVAYLESIDPSDLDVAPGRSPFGNPGSANRFAEFTIQRTFRQVVGELMQHLATWRS